jgi:cytochrome c oxidase cbb3-type subunit III
MMRDDAFKELERHNKVPRLFLAFFFALIAWGVYYIAAYTPQISGWSQYKVFDREVEAERAAAAVTVPMGNPYGQDPEAVAEGRGIYQENCAACHGEALTGEVGPGLTGRLKFGETDDRKFESVAKGRPGGMPSFESQLGRDRIWKLLAYVDSVREYGKEP